MYCDFCGKQLSTNVKYCRHCGRRLIDRLEDTRPLPVIQDSMVTMNGIKRQAASLFPWSNLPLSRKFSFNKMHAQKVVYGIVSFAIVVVMIYIIMTFKTIKEYQILTAIGATLLAIYTWRKSR